MPAMTDSAIRLRNDDDYYTPPKATTSKPPKWLMSRLRKRIEELKPNIQQDDNCYTLYSWIELIDRLFRFVTEKDYYNRLRKEKEENKEEEEEWDEFDAALGFKEIPPPPYPCTIRWIDHFGIYEDDKGNSVVFSEPYGLCNDSILSIMVLAQEINLDVRIDAASYHYPGHTLRIELRPLGEQEAPIPTAHISTTPFPTAPFSTAPTPIAPVQPV